MQIDKTTKLVYLCVKPTVRVVCPRIVGPDHQLPGVEHRKAVDNVGAEAGVDVLRLVLALARPVPGPIRKVADDLAKEWMNIVAKQSSLAIIPFEL